MQKASQGAVRRKHRSASCRPISCFLYIVQALSFNAPDRDSRRPQPLEQVPSQANRERHDALVPGDSSTLLMSRVTTTIHSTAWSGWWRWRGAVLNLKVLEKGWESENEWHTT
jgi:hypothetical protein